MKRLWRRLRNRANKLLVQIQNDLLRNRRVIGRPFQLTLESGNVCNLRCPLCPTTHREARLPKGLLRLEDARRILDRFPYTVQLVLSNWGEPFLNPDVFAIVREAKARDVRVKLESNFTIFDEEKARRLVDSGLDVLVLALDGASQETYVRYRVGGDLERAIVNVRLLRRVQDELDDHRTRVVWKFVVNRFNEHELELARRRAEEIGLAFETVTVWAPRGEAETWLPTRRDAMGSRTETGAPSRCHNLWQAVSVNFNGDVFPCCSEFSPQDRLVNVLDEPFEPFWNGPEYRARRAANRGPVDCERCHRDRETRWYRAWRGSERAPAERAAGAE